MCIPNINQVHQSPVVAMTLIISAPISLFAAYVKGIFRDHSHDNALNIHKILDLIISCNNTHLLGHRFSVSSFLEPLLPVSVHQL